jgi:hypothetical protein
MFNLLGIASAVIILRTVFRYWWFFILVGAISPLFFKHYSEAEVKAAWAALDKCAAQHHIKTSDPRLQQVCPTQFKMLAKMM